MKYPTHDQVYNASRTQLAKWQRFLPSPENVTQREVLKQIRFQLAVKGGITPQISKQIGWQE